MKRLMVGILVVGVFSMLLSCGDKNVGTASSNESFGHLRMAVTIVDHLYDVVGVQVKIFADTSKECNDDTIYTKTNPLISVPQVISDALFVLPAGDYKVCAIPVRDLTSNAPSNVCTLAIASPVTVFAETVEEITLVSHCNKPNGGLDVITTFDDLALIADLTIDPNKFITTCEKATITVTASNPVGGALVYRWSIVEPQPPIGEIVPNATGETAVFSTNTAGEYKVKVMVSNTYGNSAALTFPIHVRECCDTVCTENQVCCDGTCKTGNACESCGDGIVSEGETCDPPSSCPTTCVDDGDPCTDDTLTGSADACTAACPHSQITTCGPNEGCCPFGCVSDDTAPNFDINCGQEY
jgi:hypothetical protein